MLGGTGGQQVAQIDRYGLALDRQSGNRGDAVKLHDAWKKHFPKLKLSCIGKTYAGEGITIRDKSGTQKLDAHGYVHFT